MRTFTLGKITRHCYLLWARASAGRFRKSSLRAARRPGRAGPRPPPRPTYRWNMTGIVTRGRNEEGLYCKRPIQCLASIDPPPPQRPRGESSLLWGEDTLAGWRGGGGLIFRKTTDTALYSIYVSTLWGGISRSRNMWRTEDQSR